MITFITLTVFTYICNLFSVLFAYKSCSDIKWRYNYVVATKNFLCKNYERSIGGNKLL